MESSAAHVSTLPNLSQKVQQWEKAGVTSRAVESLARDLHERGGVDLSECFIDGSFCIAKKEGFCWQT
jgi:hypothetical protein